MAAHDDSPELPAPDAAALEAVRAQTLGVFREVLGSPDEVALLDIPTHQNVGDTMIWLGEERYIEQLGSRVGHVSDLIRFDAEMLRKRVPNGPILMHGGGNFGDLWPLFQDFREDIARTFPDRQIVQLPQTVHFNSPDVAAQANEVLGAHPDYTLMVRDHISFARATESLPDVRTVFCPDMALGWTPTVDRLAPAQTRMLVLARKDREAASGLRDRLSGLITPEDIVMDWGLSGAAQLSWLAARIPGRISKVAPRLRTNALLDRAVVKGYRTNLRQHIDPAVGLFAGSRFVVTDRLHAHVLAGLLGIPHLVLDNSYGKVGNIYRDYTNLFSSATFVSDPGTVSDLVVDALSGARNAVSES